MEKTKPITAEGDSDGSTITTRYCRRFRHVPGAELDDAPRAIVTPLIDTLCCGGLSIVAISGYLIYRWLINPLGPQQASQYKLEDLQALLALNLLINWPHFMASYRILYGSPQQVRGHRWASIWLPILLVGIATIALVSAATGTTDGTDANRLPELASVIFEGLGVAGAVYLAWHYTGQSWGMTASFAFVGGVRIQPAERTLIRTSYRILLTFHVCWWLHKFAMMSEVARFRELANDAYVTVAILAGLGSLVGAIGFWRIWQRTGRIPPWRCMLPWVANCLWYFLIFIHPHAFIFLQISHALQYLIFPLRVDLNRRSREGKTGISNSVGHATLLHAAFIAAGALVFLLPEHLTFLQGNMETHLAATIASIVNIHHYFVDGVIWKISSPTVQKDLFSHLQH